MQCEEAAAALGAHAMDLPGLFSTLPAFFGILGPCTLVTPLSAFFSAQALALYVGSVCADVAGLSSVVASKGPMYVYVAVARDARVYRLGLILLALGLRCAVPSRQLPSTRRRG